MGILFPYIVYIVGSPFKIRPLPAPVSMPTSLNQQVCEDFGVSLDEWIINHEIDQGVDFLRFRQRRSSFHSALDGFGSATMTATFHCYNHFFK